MTENWRLIEIGNGKQGINGRWRVTPRGLSIFLHGSDHSYDWLHHVVVLAGWRERKWARRIADMFEVGDDIDVYIGCHSLGVAVAVPLAVIMQARGHVVRVFGFGGKQSSVRPGKLRHTTFYRRRGDIVPLLMPWRWWYRGSQVFGEWLPFWRAHEPREYAEKIKEHGFD